jgi:recombinase
MAKVERFREVLYRPFDEGYFRAKLNEGWRLIAVHWERDVEDATPEAARWTEEVPYGLRVADDCVHLEEDPAERPALELMLKLISSDKSMSQIARELNDQKLRNRNGTPWTQTAVFNMLPRLIEAAPHLWKKEG